MRGLYVKYEDFHLIHEVLLDRFVTNSRGVLVSQVASMRRIYISLTS